MRDVVSLGLQAFAAAVGHTTAPTVRPETAQEAEQSAPAPWFSPAAVEESERVVSRIASDPVLERLAELSSGPCSPLAAAHLMWGGR